jgi:hypothetical protein
MNAKNAPAKTPKSQHLDCANALRLPASIETPRIEVTEWGGRLPGQDYFPMYLGNGRDAMLINLMGSGEMHWERQMRSSSPLTRLLNTEWFKADRRDYAHSRLVYGQLMPFVDFSSGPMLRGDAVVPRDVKQFFDPKTATVTTFIRQLDNRTSEPLELRSQTFLTHDGMLVQTVHCLEAPSEGVQYVFTMGEPGPDYQNAKVPLIKPDNARFEPDGDNANLLCYSSTWAQGRTAGFSLVGGVEVEDLRMMRQDLPPCVQADQVTRRFHKGSTVWRVLSLQDSREGDDPDFLCERLLKRIEEEGIQGIHNAHCAQWAEYFSTSSVELPDPAAQYLYEVSRYVVKANLHPCGFLPMGTLPYLWQGAMFWDASFGHQALLGCGNLAEARSITGHFASLESHGRALAEKLGSSGIRIEWTVNLFDFSKYDPPMLQVHNNAVWARAFMLNSAYSGEPMEASSLGFIRELLLFLIDRLVEKGSDPAEAPIIGIDESHSDPKPNDTWTVAVCLRALEEFQEICQNRGIDTDIPKIEEAQARLRSLLLKNTDDRNVLQSFTGGAVPNWGSLVFDLYPDAPQALPTLAKMSENYCEEFDLFNFHGQNRYAERAFPWSNNWVARCLARMQRREALQFWLHNTRSTNIFGGVPERVYYHGENYINWCMTCHAAQVWAMNAMLADFQDGTLTLLGGIDPTIWTDIAFEGIRTAGGLSISLRMENCKITKLVIESSGSEPISVQINAPHLGAKNTFILSPGRNQITHPMGIPLA